MNRQEQFRERLMALGFDDVRFAVVQPVPGKTLQAWLAAGMQGDMQWMERTAEKRLQPELVLTGAKSIVMFGINYWSRDEAAGAKGNAGKPVWARYARYEDYHDTIKPALERAGHLLREIYGGENADYRYYVDTGPVLERGWAARAGVGFVGKNAMLISRRHGNWLFLAAMLTRIEFVPDPPVRRQASDFADVGVGANLGPVLFRRIGNALRNHPHAAANVAPDSSHAVALAHDMVK